MAIDKKLLHVKAYYLTRFAGVGPVMPYLSMICYHKGLPLAAVGMIWGILSFTGFVWRSTGGALADYFKAYRGFFMISLFTVAVAYVGVFTSPNIPGTKVEIQSASSLVGVQMPSWNFRLGFPDLDTGADLEDVDLEMKVDKFNVSCEEGDLVLSFQPLTTFPEHLKNRDLRVNETITFLPHARLALSCNSDCLKENTPCAPVALDLETSDFTRVAISSSTIFVTAVSCNSSEDQPNSLACPQVVDGEGKEEVFDCQLLQTPGVASSDAANRILTNESGRKQPKPAAEEEFEAESLASVMEHLVMQYQFWVMFGFLLLLYFGLTVSLTMADTICFYFLGPNRRHLFGKQRMWGMVGRGSMAFLAGALVDWYSKESETVNYLPCFALGTTFILLDVVLVSRLDVDIGSKKKLQMTEVGRTLWKPRALLYLMNAFVMGVNVGITFTFNLILIEALATEWDSSFKHVKFLQGIALTVACFGGEVPLLFLSGTFLKRFGADIMFFVVMCCQGVRCGLVSFVSNPWCLLPVELLSGATFGLFNACNAFCASKIAPTGAEATVQGFFGSTLFGGWSIGGVIGGLLFNSVGGVRTYLYLSCFTIVYTSLYACAQCLITKFLDQRDSTEVDVEYISPDQEPSLPKLVRRPSVYSSATSI